MPPVAVQAQQLQEHSVRAVSTKSARAAAPTLGGRRSAALNASASHTVARGALTSDCST